MRCRAPPPRGRPIPPKIKPNLAIPLVKTTNPATCSGKKYFPYMYLIALFASCLLLENCFFEPIISNFVIGQMARLILQSDDEMYESRVPPLTVNPAIPPIIKPNPAIPLPPWGGGGTTNFLFVLIGDKGLIFQASTRFCLD